MIICINTTKIKYSSPLLDRYCKLREMLCISYAIDYNASAVRMESNLNPIQVNEFYFNPNACLAQPNFESINPELKNSLHQVEQLMHAATTKYSYCIKVSFVKALIGKFLNGLFGLVHYGETDQEPVLKIIENECPYGDGKTFCIGTHQDWCSNNLPELAMAHCSGTCQDESKQILNLLPSTT
jgi:hypothetical protein